MKNNSKQRKQERRERARISLLRMREMHQATIDDRRVDDRHQSIAQSQIKRIDQELEAIGQR